MSVSMKLLLITLSLSLTHAKNFEYRLIQSNNIQRQELLQQKCDKYDLDNNELYQNNSIHNMNDADLEHLLIDRKHKFLYCYVPKVSSFLVFIRLRPSVSSLIERSFFFTYIINLPNHANHHPNNLTCLNDKSGSKESKCSGLRTTIIDLTEPATIS